MSDVKQAPKYMDHSELIEAELEALYQVSTVLSKSLYLKETLQSVLDVLHEYAGMERGMVTLLQPESGDLLVSAIHDGNGNHAEEVRYQHGEGIVGNILMRDETVMIERIADEPRFLGKLGLYDPELSFIGVPIRIGSLDPVGVLAAQPTPGPRMLLRERAHFLKMVANLIAQTVRLSWEVENEKRNLAGERDRLRQEVRSNYGFDNIVGHSDAMRMVFEQVRQVSKWDSTVLIRGESGTGKELISNAIHYNSPRADRPFVKLNCAALSDSLLETELFGHEKGAFTGAVNQRKGRFELAHGGTIFLDEIGEITPVFQAKLLRVLQEGEFERVGGSKTIKVDVRVIAATNRDLEQNVQDGDFREDLYYRLNVMPIYIPALRDRAEDIPDVARFLVGKLAKRQGRELSITDPAIRMLMQHAWPGNVRELENTLERAAIMSEDGTIDEPQVALTGIAARPITAMQAARPAAAAVDLDDLELDERDRIIAALEQAGWVQAKAARLLDMTPRQIAYRVKTLNIEMRKI
jgi:Nif-specific regulatory protein